MGASLARIHCSRVAGYGDLIQPDELCSNPQVPFTLKFDEGFAECSDHLPKQLLEQCRLYFDTHINLLATADGPCIVHRDFRPGNVMVHEGKIQGIIDWASARASFAQEDFCSMEHGEWATNATNKKSFLAGYASIRPVPEYSAMMPLLRLNKAIATIGFTVKIGTWDTTHARLYKTNRQFLEKGLHMSTTDIRSSIHQVVSAITPFDTVEQEHIGFTLQWIESGSELFRIEKPATPDTHLVSYFAVVSEDMEQFLLVDHKLAKLWLPPGGHVEPGEDPKETVKREAKEELGIEAEFFFDEPVFLTARKTAGTINRHTDVSLWYVLKGNPSDALEYDSGEFHQIR